jgi:predicted transcriptional regulator
MKAKPTPKPATTLVNFRLPHTSIAKLNDVATVMRRTRKSIVDQLIEKFCDVKNLQP